MTELQQLLDRLVAAGAPGAAGWVRNERGSLGAASGLADRRTRQPMRPELRFRAGSVTKSLVAAVVLRLAAKAGCRWPTPGALAARDPALRRPYLSIVLSPPDGRRQLGVMINLLAAPDAVYKAFMRVVGELSSIRPGVARQV